MSRVLVITSSLRAGSNSDILAQRLTAGAKDAGHEVETVSLKGKKINFCTGCLACQKIQRCVQKDDALEIAEQVRTADTLVFVTPIYYYEMSGQMKTLLDRMNPLYGTDCRFTRVYMMSVAADEDEKTPCRAVSGLEGWVSCFEKAELCGTLFCGGLNDPAQVSGQERYLRLAYDFGRQIL